jgi:hypothetical protein
MCSNGRQHHLGSVQQPPLDFQKRREAHYTAPPNRCTEGCRPHTVFYGLRAIASLAQDFRQHIFRQWDWQVHKSQGTAAIGTVETHLSDLEADLGIPYDLWRYPHPLFDRHMIVRAKHTMKKWSSQQTLRDMAWLLNVILPSMRGTMSLNGQDLLSSAQLVDAQLPFEQAPVWPLMDTWNYRIGLLSQREGETDRLGGPFVIESGNVDILVREAFQIVTRLITQRRRTYILMAANRIYLLPDLFGQKGLEPLWQFRESA